jgi:SIT4-associating protein SAP185/190
MFWRFGGYANISTLDTILDKPDVTLEELLNESDLIQELKQSNSKLVDFLRDEAVLDKLLHYVTADKASAAQGEREKTEDKVEDEKPVTGISFFGGKGKSRSRSKSVNKRDDDGQSELEKNETQRKRYAHVACEVLSSEVWSIMEALLENPKSMLEFWQYLWRPAPLDPVQAGYFTKVNETLLDKKTEEMLILLKSMDGVVPAMLQHVDCPMIMDLLLKIISLEKQEGGQGTVDWLQSQGLIPLLLSYLSPEHASSTQTSAGDFLKAIITISANATTQDASVIGPNELTRELVSEKCIKALITDMLRGGNPLTVGVGIIIEVIRKNNSDYDLDNQVGPEPKTSDPIYLGTLLRQFAVHIPDFMHLIRSSSARRSPLKVAFGSKIEPLGFDRFKTCELMAELLHCSNMGLLNERGAEAEVQRRDAKREKMKSEGRLATSLSVGSPNHELSHDEFGSSVDSAGFHHAARPFSDEYNEKAEEDPRLDLNNATDEDGFEKVNVPADDLPDEVSFDDLHEKLDSKTAPTLHMIPPRSDSLPKDLEDVPKPLSPTKKTHNLPDQSPAQAAESPTTAGVTDSIRALGVKEDSLMRELNVDVPEGASESEQALAHPGDKPAPLFAKKAEATSDVADLDQSTATIQGNNASATGNADGAYEAELDGAPVVGDLLKTQFVEHQVVPTILVSHARAQSIRPRSITADSFAAVGFLFPVPLE